MHGSTRVFFGFALAPRDRIIVERAQQVLRERVGTGGQGRVRWVPAGDFHLTLRFIGVVPCSALADHARALGRALSGAAPVAVSVEGFSGFPSARRARTLVLALRDPAERLAAMARRLEHELERLGIVPEPRPLVPHVTLARVSSALDMAQLANVSAHHDSEIMLSRLCLFESRGARADTRYAPLSELQLAREHTSGSA